MLRDGILGIFLPFHGDSSTFFHVWGNGNIRDDKREYVT